MKLECIAPFSIQLKHARLAQVKGDVFEVDDANAKVLIKLNVAKEVEAVKVPTTKSKTKSIAEEASVVVEKVAEKVETDAVSAE